MRVAENLTVAMIVLALIGVHFAEALTDLDYSFSKSKTGYGRINSNRGYHGPSSAEMMIHANGSSRSLPLTFEEPMPLSRMDEAAFCLQPVSGSGSLEVEIRLDGDGDGIYDSKNPRDARLIAVAGSWGNWEHSPPVFVKFLEQGWMEVDVTGMEIQSKSADPNLIRKGLSWREADELMGDRAVVKVYLILRRKGTEDANCLLDYIRLGDEIVSFEALEKAELKKGKMSSCKPGSTITYIITYGNNLDRPQDVKVVEKFDPRTILIEAYPPPNGGNDNIWTFEDLPPGKHGQITVKVKTVKPSPKAEMDGSVSGHGFVSVRGHLSTYLPGYMISNQVNLISQGFNRSSRIYTWIKSVPGMQMNYRESGSGSYLSYHSLNSSSTRLGIAREIAAIQEPTTCNLTRGRAIFLQSSWSSSQDLEDTKTQAFFRERYSHCQELNHSASARSYSSRPSWSSSCKFQGMGKQEIRWRDNSLMNFLVGNFTTRTLWHLQEKSGRATPEKQGLGCLGTFE